MSELRQQLAEALKGGLAKHGYPMATDTANYLADTLLSIPGIAITELPEADDVHNDGIAFWWKDAEVGVDREMVIARLEPGADGTWINAESARSLAAVLLAAAAKAEEMTE